MAESMINHTMGRKLGKAWWILSPSRLIDNILDHIEKLRALVLPGEVDISSEYAEIKVHFEQLGR